MMKIKMNNNKIKIPMKIKDNKLNLKLILKIIIKE